MTRRRGSTESPTKGKNRIYPIDKTSCIVKFHDRSFEFELNNGLSKQIYSSDITSPSIQRLESENSKSPENNIQVVFLKKLLQLVTDTDIIVYTNDSFLTGEYFKYFSNDKRFKDIQIRYFGQVS